MGSLTFLVHQISDDVCHVVYYTVRPLRISDGVSHLDSLYSVLNVMTYVTFGFMHVGLPLSAVTLVHTLLYPLNQVRYDLCHIGFVHVFFSH